VNESLPVRLWVDVEPPQVSLFSPNPGTFCGSIIQSGVDVSRSFQFTNTAYPSVVTVNVETGGILGPDYVFTNSTAIISVTLPLGRSTIRATSTDAAGNTGTFQVQGDDCTVLVGEPPLVAWNSPTSGAILNAAGTAPGSGTLQDADANTAGWQGDLSVTVTNIDLAGADAAGVVQFKIEGVAVGAPIALSSGTGSNTSRTVTLAAASYAGIPDGAAVDVSVEVTGTQEAGGATLANLLVDTVAPSGVTDALAAVGSGTGDRRRTRVHVT